MRLIDHTTTTELLLLWNSWQTRIRWGSLLCVLGLFLLSCNPLQGNECRSAQDCAGTRICVSGWCQNPSVQDRPNPIRRPPPHRPRVDLHKCPTEDAKVLNEDFTAIRGSFRNVGLAAFHGNYIYWTDTQHGHILRQHLHTHESEVVYNTIHSIQKWIFDDEYIYAVVVDPHHPSSSTLLRLDQQPTDGATPKVLADRVSAMDTLVHNKTHLFWLTVGALQSTSQSEQKGALFSVPKQGNASQVKKLLEQKRPYALTLDEQHIYWITSHKKGALKRMPLQGGKVDVLVENLPFADRIAQQDEYIYYTTNNLWRIHKKSYTTPERLTRDLRLNDAFAIDSLFIYTATTLGLVQVPIHCTASTTPTFSNAAPGHITSIFVHPKHIYLQTQMGRNGPTQFYSIRKRPSSHWFHSGKE